jgi:hypothetical protein
MDAAATYLVVIDDSPESRLAMRFAVLRAAHVDADVALASVVTVGEFLQFGAVQSAMVAQARDEAAALLAEVAGDAEALSGRRPATILLDGEPASAVLAYVRENPGVRALVLGTSARGGPGPLVGYFTGERAADLPCILMLVPGGLDPERLATLA